MNGLELLKAELKLRGFSPLTVRNYSFFVGKFLESANKNESELDQNDVKAYLSKLYENKSKNTIMLAAAALKFFFAEVLKKNFEQIKIPKKDRALPSVLTKEEVIRIIDSTDNEKSRLIISFLYSTGLRVSELVNLKKEDLNFSENTGWVRKGKGAKDRIFVMSSSLSKEVEEFVKKKNYNFVFSKEKPLTTRNIQKIIKNTKTRAGIQKNVTPHTLRHTYATHLLEQGTDIRMIQALLGHSSLSTTQVYTHISSDAIRKVKNPFDSLNI